MPIPTGIEERLRVPAIAAPMYQTSGPDLVVAACTRGVIGAFPSLNAADPGQLDRWLADIRERLAHHDGGEVHPSAPYAVNLVVRFSSSRYRQDLDVCEHHRVPIVITSLGAVPELVHRIHDYGGWVFHDVTTVRHAEKAVAAGVDGLILVTAGAGGHAGTLNPFALIPEVRSFFDGTIVLAGCISTGDQILAAEIIGADMAYLGTRFIATNEALCSAENKQMIVDCDASQIIYTAHFSGVPANYLRPSVIAAGFDPELLGEGPELDLDTPDRAGGRRVWSAGQGCGSIHSVLPAASLCDRLVEEYRAAVEDVVARRPCDPRIGR